MNVFMFGILICLSSFRCKALATYLATNDTVLNDANSRNILDMQSTFIINHGVDLQEETSQYAECICKNGQCITDSEGTAHCACPPEFGKYTTTSCKACECGKGANCTFEPSIFSDVKKCICPFGFKETGDRCEDACTNAPCKNGGTCQPMGKTFKCTCRETYFGDTCEKEECKCEKGKCIEKDGKMVCTCPPEFGVFKGNSKVECRACECGKGANCTFDLVLITYFKKCICPFGFKESGAKCEDACTNAPCKNNGTCEPIGKSFKCICKEPYFGDTCEKDVCTNAPCKNGGTCRSMGNFFKCTCRETYFGDTCEKDACTNAPCENGGTCQLMGKTFNCTCRMPYYGDTCEKGPCTNNPCKNGGTCKVYKDAFMCDCPAPYSGNICERDPCTTNPCENGGTCKVDRNTFKCDCEAPYSGNTCERDPCTSNPCKNGGTCKVDGNTFKCDCAAPYSGNTCERDPCRSNPCKNGGTCMLDGNSFKCDCAAPYSGNTCERETCVRDTDCLNGGSCERSVDGYFCACPDGFAGDHCQVNAMCETLKCDVMRAVCRRTRDGAVCECPPEKAYKWFTGVCEDICDSRKCVNGKCEITGKGFTCICDEGFTGLRCEEKVSAKQDLTIYMIGFTMLSAAILLSTIGTFYLVCVARRTGKAKRSELVE